MSLFPVGIPLVQIAPLLFPVFFRRYRAIGGIIANATISERAIDELEVTQHPVETGSNIADHAFQRPSRITINAGWSNSSLQALGNPNYVVTIYEALQALQQSREPFEVVSGKRVYANMLMTRLYQETDERSENALVAMIDCQQVILASTQTVTVPTADKMKDPQTNAATTNTGTKQLSSGEGFQDGPRTRIVINR